MRAYSFVHFQIGSIGKGIQSMHSFIEMREKYDEVLISKLGWNGQHHTYRDWARNHKTLIILNGGNCAGLKEIVAEFESLDADDIQLAMPFCAFYEDEETLNGAITCVSIIVPERIYVTAEKVRNRQMFISAMDGIIYDNENVREEFSAKEIQLINRLNSHGLAS